MITRYELHRSEDPSGISGTGKVAEAVRFSNGWTIVCWTIKPDKPSIVIYKDFLDAIAIHGHGGLTQFVEVP